MGLVSLSYVFMSSIALFACVLQLILSFRKSDDLTFLVGAVISLVVFTHFIAKVLCETQFGIDCPPITFYRFALVTGLAIHVSMLSIIAYMMKENRKLFFLISAIGLTVLLLASLLMPADLLFGENFTIRRLTVAFGDDVLVMNTGNTLWRLISIASVCIFVFSAYILLLKKWNRLTVISNIILLTGLAFVLISIILDYLIDLGQMTLPYTWPFALFVLYIILLLIPLLIFIRKIKARLLAIQKENLYQNLINEADLVVVELNRMGHVEFINSYFYKLTGFTQNEVIGKDWFEFFIPSRDFYNVQGTFVELLESEIYDQYINPVLTKNGEEKLIRWFNIRTHDRNGEINGSFSIGIDVTDEIAEKESLKLKLLEVETLVIKMRKTGK
jgi:PAS domain S-box-containing protein